MGNANIPITIIIIIKHLIKGANNPPPNAIAALKFKGNSFFIWFHKLFPLNMIAIILNK
jgi:hypothetical protein